MNRLAQLLVRNVSDDVKERLRARAKRHGRSLEAEARAILSDAASAQKSQGVAEKAPAGSWVKEAVRRMKKIGLTKKDMEALEANIREHRKAWRPRSLNLDK